MYSDFLEESSIKSLYFIDLVKAICVHVLTFDLFRSLLAVLAIPHSSSRVTLRSISWIYKCGY